MLVNSNKRVDRTRKPCICWNLLEHQQKWCLKVNQSKILLGQFGIYISIYMISSKLIW